MKLVLALLITTSVVLSIIGDVFLKKSAGDTNQYLLLGFLLYGLAAIPIAIVFRHIEFGIVFIIWEAIVIILGLAIGTLIFKETLTTSKLIALLLALSAVVVSYK